MCKKLLHYKKIKELKKDCQIKKCIKQPALNAEKNVKFHSNLTQADQFIAENATQKNARQDHRHQDDIKLTHLALNFQNYSLFFYVFCFA
jgi:hypothetical protein